MVLKENNFTEFKIKKNSNGEYVLNVDEKDIGKPMFASYTGSETREEREIIKNVLNSSQDLKRVGNHEVVLYCIHLGRYGLDLRPNFSLCELLTHICMAGAIDRVRLSSIEPLEVSSDILKLTRKSNPEYGQL